MVDAYLLLGNVEMAELKNKKAQQEILCGCRIDQKLKLQEGDWVIFNSVCRSMGFDRKPVMSS